MAQTALLLPVSRVAPLIQPWARRYDPSAVGGVPPHVTVLFPFLPPEDITREVADRLRHLSLRHEAFTTDLADVGMFADGEVLHLRPDPDTPFRELAHAIRAQWPGLEPYGGRHDDPVPHVTVGFGIPRASARHAARSLLLSLPLPVHVDVLQVWGTDEEGWHHLLSFPLRPAGR